MSCQTTDSRIAIDGGGTSCRVALMWQGQRFDAKTGPANAFTDIDGTVATVLTGLTQVAKAAGQDLPALADIPAYIGLAGVITPKIAQSVAARLPLRQATICDDRASALVGALGGMDGTLISIGTGSFLGRRTGDQTRLIGGYGLNLGDEASGAWLGRALLARLLHVADGLHGPSDLTETIFARFDRDISKVIAFAARTNPQDYGRFAPEIAKAATNDDVTAIDLMNTGANYITSGLAALGWQPNEPMVLLGGVADSYVPFLGPDIAGSIIAAKGSALDGALALAQPVASVSGDCTP